MKIYLLVDCCCEKSIYHEDCFQDDVMLVNDAYKVISAIVATKVGREAFIASRGMRVLSLLNIRQVSCDWWTAGHVTQCSLLIGPGVPGRGGAGAAAGAADR